jgi:hypothetical protein
MKKSATQITRYFTQVAPGTGWFIVEGNVVKPISQNQPNLISDQDE